MQMLKLLKSKIPRFWKNVSVVLVGAVVYQLFPLAVLPVLTRLLDSGEIGKYFTWYGGVLVLTVVMSLRFDMALFQAKTDEDARSVVRSVAVVGGFITCIFLSSIQVALYLVPDLTVGSLSSDFLHLLVLSSYALGTNLVVSSFYARNALFKVQAVWKIFLGAGTAFLQLIVALSGFGAHGLVLSQTIASVLVTLFMLRHVGVRFAHFFDSEKLKSSFLVFKEFKRFAYVSMPSALINTAALYLPLFLIGGRIGSSGAAYYGLTQRTLSAPLGLVGRSITAAFREETSRVYRETGGCLQEYLRTFRALAILGILPFGLLALFGPTLFQVVFGDSWREAGVLAQYLSPMFYVRFIASPLSYMFFLSNKNSHDLVWQIALLLLTAAVFSTTLDLNQAVLIYSTSCALLYSINLYMSYKIACGALSGHAEKN